MTGYINFPSWLTPEIIPGLPVRWYGLMYIVAFGLTYLLFQYQIKERKLGFSKELTSNFFFWTIVGLVLGARLGFAFIYDVEGVFRAKPWLVLWPFDESGAFTGLSGMSFHGGVVGAIIGAMLFAKKYKVDFLQWADLIMAGLPLGYTFGRLGNFINGELYGRVTDAPWGVIFPQAEKLSTSLPWVQELMVRLQVGNPAQDLVNLPRHPSQLYEALGEGLLLFLIFWFLLQRTPRFKGFFLGLFIVGYGAVRFIVEYFRNPDKGMDFPLAFDTASIMDSAGNLITSHLVVSPWNFSMGQILSALMVIGGTVFLVYRWQAEKNLAAQPAVPPPAAETPAKAGKKKK